MLLPAAVGAGAVAGPVQRGGVRQRVERVRQAVGLDRVEAHALRRGLVDDAVERDLRHHAVDVAQRALALEIDAAEEGEVVLAGVRAHGVREVEDGLGRRRLGQGAQRHRQAAQAAVGPPRLEPLVLPRLPDGLLHAAAECGVERVDDIADALGLLLGEQVEMVEVVLEPRQRREQRRGVVGERLEHPQLAAVRDQHAAPTRPDQLGDQPLQRADRRRPPAEGQVRLVEVEDEARRRQLVHAAGAGAVAFAFARERRRSGLAAEPVELERLEPGQVDPDEEVVGGQRRGLLPRTAHRDVDLGQARARALRQADVAGLGLRRLRLPRLPRLLPLLRRAGQPRRGRRQRQRERPADLPEAHTSGSRWTRCDEAWSAGSSRRSATATWGGRVAANSTASATSSAASGVMPR